MIMITVNFIEVRVGSRSLIKSRLFESVTVTVLAVAATVWCVSDWQHPAGGPAAGLPRRASGPSRFPDGRRRDG